MPISKSEIGARGEQLAAEYLTANGFELLHRNWRSGRYELDIVARRGDVVHFVEVKSRKRGGLTAPEEAITEAKFRALCKAAEAYIEEFGVEQEVQFDVVAVEHSGGRAQVRYIPEAMYPKW